MSLNHEKNRFENVVTRKISEKLNKSIDTADIFAQENIFAKSKPYSNLL